jgi:hypothetical protein
VGDTGRAPVLTSIEGGSIMSPSPRKDPPGEKPENPIKPEKPKPAEHPEEIPNLSGAGEDEEKER